MIGQLTQYVGTVIEVYTVDEDSFFTAALFKEDHLGRLLRIRGKVILGAGDRVRIFVYPVSDPRFGLQYECVDFQYLSTPPWKALS